MNTKTHKTRQRTRSGVGTGTTSLLMIFTVLCFATLALLSLSTATANQRIQQRSLDGTAALATAEGEAAVKLAELDTALQRGAAENTAAGLGWQATESEGVYQYTVPIDENHELVTTVEIQGDRSSLLSQKSVYIGSWEPETEGQIWSGA
ncbi:hypothetical protein LJC49_10670 [Ruminococcaceae bacterium OttesenSCG-928-I18]|nr:hypothetical protein [Ruminococcaceae bacterium OttesenSCG-928-I18]